MFCLRLRRESHSVVSFATPGTVACQVPLFMGFSRPEYWSGQPFSSPGIFPTQRLNQGIPHCRQILSHLSHKEAQIISGSFVKCKFNLFFKGRSNYFPEWQYYFTFPPAMYKRSNFSVSLPGFDIQSLLLTLAVLQSVW